MALTWTYKEFWSWFDQVDTVSKKLALKELVKDGWLRNSSARVQWEVLKFAPPELREVAKTWKIIKPEVRLSLLFGE